MSGGRKPPAPSLLILDEATTLTEEREASTLLGTKNKLHQNLKYINKNDLKYLYV
jgi:energy-coupling factor transporter ATP-binding protein EcfA2